MRRRRSGESPGGNAGSRDGTSIGSAGPTRRRVAAELTSGSRASGIGPGSASASKARDQDGSPPRSRSNVYPTRSPCSRLKGVPGLDVATSSSSHIGLRCTASSTGSSRGSPASWARPDPQAAAAHRLGSGKSATSRLRYVHDPRAAHAPSRYIRSGPRRRAAAYIRRKSRAGRGLRMERSRLPLHTNACGDFTSDVADDWERVGGYLEFEMYSMHIDNPLLYAAHYVGVRGRPAIPRVSRRAR